jgi:hypothetical protein
MSILRIPVTNDDPWYTFLTRLESIPVTFEIKWNARDGFWHFALLDDDGAPYFGPRRIVLGIDLWARCLDSRRPPGSLVAYDTSGRGQEAAYPDLGTRVQLLYVTSDELSA